MGIVCVHRWLATLKMCDMLKLLAGLPGGVVTPHCDPCLAADLLCHQHGEDGSPHSAGTRCQ